jgi:hypothetical protein
MRSWRDGVWKRLCPKNTKPKSESSEVELRRAVEINSCLETWCAGAVVAALVFEAIVLWWYANPKKWHETAGLILCDVLLAVAIGWEIVFGRRANNAQSDLQLISNKKVEDAYRIAAEAQDRLSKLLEWRKLDAEQTDRIVRKLEQYAGTQYSFDLAMWHPELINLAKDIASALNRARWRQRECVDTRDSRAPLWGPKVCLGAPVVGVVVVSWPETTLEDAKVALIGALVKEGIETQRVTMKVPIRTILIMIGPKM